MQFLTFLNLYCIACGTAELPADVCPGKGTRVAAMARTVLLTGGVGFIGAGLCRLWKTAVPPF